MKEVEIIIRTQADKEKLEKLKADGWRVLNQAYVTEEGEPTRALFQLYKEDSGSK